MKPASDPAGKITGSCIFRWTVDRHIGRYVGRYSVDSRPSVGRHSGRYVDRQLTEMSADASIDTPQKIHDLKKPMYLFIVA